MSCQNFSLCTYVQTPGAVRDSGSFTAGAEYYRVFIFVNGFFPSLVRTSSAHLYVSGISPMNIISAGATNAGS